MAGTPIGQQPVGEAQQHGSNNIGKESAGQKMLRSEKRDASQSPPQQRSQSPSNKNKKKIHVGKFVNLLDFLNNKAKLDANSQLNLVQYLYTSENVKI